MCLDLVAVALCSLLPLLLSFSGLVLWEEQQHLCLAGWRERILLLFLLSVLHPLCSSHQLPMAACNNSLPAALVLQAAATYFSASIPAP